MNTNTVRALELFLLFLLLTTLTYASFEARHHQSVGTRQGESNFATDQNHAMRCDSSGLLLDNATETSCLANLLDAAKDFGEEEEEDVTEEEEEDIISEATYQVTSPAVRVLDDENRGEDIGVKQVIDPQHSIDVKERILQARTYVANVVNVNPEYESVRNICQNQHELCAFWSVLGECDKNPGYMHINCAPVCQTCDLLDIKKRCPMDPDAKDSLYPGDLDHLFENILTDPAYQIYEPHVVSRPTLAPGDTDEASVDYKVGGPWMVVFENVLSEDEAQHLISWGAKMGYRRSEDVGTKKADGTYTSYSNAGRTSTNSWCTDDCYEDPINIRIMDRIANITGIPEANSENLQLLRYEQDQFYQTHSDYIPFQRERQSGVRILTFYMYLNTLEEEQGGGTNFPHLDLTVKPKRGRAALWPSVLNRDPNAKDFRSDHQALPVLGDGIKYGANAWLHQRDYKTPNSVGC